MTDRRTSNGVCIAIPRILTREWLTNGFYFQHVIWREIFHFRAKATPHLINKRVILSLKSKIFTLKNNKRAHQVMHGHSALVNKHIQGIYCLICCVF